MSKSVYQLNEEAKIANKTHDNKFSDFSVGSRVKIICLGQDMHFFYGETGKVIKNTGNYLGIIIQFDEPRHFKDGSIQKDFNFEPSDLLLIEQIDKYHYHEAQDRMHMMATMFDEFIHEHPAILNEPHIKKKADEVAEALGDLYQLCGSVSFDFDNK